MAHRLSREEFLGNLRASGLLSPQELDSYLETLPEPRVADGEALARHLVTAGKLTPFQASAVYAGRLAELVIGNYQVLDRLGAGGMGTVYKARHRRMKRVVAIKRLITSDLSAAMLERVRGGHYTDLEVSHGLSPELVQAHFEKVEDGGQLRDDVRRLVECRPINLTGAWPEFPPLDLVLLRNVMIYFDVPTRQRLLARVRQRLHPDGYLLLGGAETTHGLDDGFTPVACGKTTFFRPLRA